MQIMTIVRGIPGSGKSTLAKILAKAYAAKHVETDMLRYAGGEYVYDAEKNEGYRKTSLMAAKLAAAAGQSVVVSNSFIYHSHYAPYQELAEEYDMMVQIIDCHGEFGSIHGVPKETLEGMREAFEPYIPTNT